MRVKYSFICDAANISQSGNLNVLGIFTNIGSKQFPFAYPKLTYVAGIEFHRSEVGQHNFKVNFIDEDGQYIIPPLNGIIDIHKSSFATNILLDINNLQLQKPGVYCIDLVMDNQHVSSETINVRQIQE